MEVLQIMNRYLPGQHRKAVLVQAIAKHVLGNPGEVLSCLDRSSLSILKQLISLDKGGTVSVDGVGLFLLLQKMNLVF